MPTMKPPPSLLLPIALPSTFEQGGLASQPIASLDANRAFEVAGKEPISSRRLPSINRYIVLAAVTAVLAGLFAVLNAQQGWPASAMLAGRNAIGAWGMVALIVFVAAAISSTVGFAFSAIAAAMILHAVPDNVEAVQIMMAASIGIQAFSVAALRRTICWRACVPFLLGGAALIPAGIYLLLTVHPQTYVALIGAAIATYGAYILFRSPLTVAKGGILANVAVGAVGGLTGPLAAFPGALITIWCGMRGWDKTVQRAIYQPYILVMQVLTLIGLSLATERAPIDPAILAYALPGVAGACLGLHVFHRLTDVQFHRLVNLALIVSGVALLVR